VYHRTAELMGSVIDGMWHVTVLDVEATVRLACKKVFKDNGVPFAQREQRAETLLAVAKIFKAKSLSAEAGLKAFKLELQKQMVEASHQQKANVVE
jgi:antitoxin component of RelBE/YafQ-DinJ toxin-antitoxin module